MTVSPITPGGPSRVRRSRASGGAVLRRIEGLVVVFVSYTLDARRAVRLLDRTPPERVDVLAADGPRPAGR
ncbi:hypothetical protein [Allokutzneria oryzae]|uniref:Uncharacterized protein n=1 Tax=Allokutzneria oryzae TaxID=1378989 RepID=A0ABV6A2X1_9PSEU